jgi:hypothetical protein
VHLYFSHLMNRLDNSPFAAVLADGMARMQHLLWRTVPLNCPPSSSITLDKSNRALLGRIVKLLNIARFVPNCATCSKEDAVAWLLKNPAQLATIAKAEACSQPATLADFDT